MWITSGKLGKVLPIGRVFTHKFTRSADFGGKRIPGIGKIFRVVGVGFDHRFYLAGDVTKEYHFIVTVLAEYRGYHAHV